MVVTQVGNEKNIDFNKSIKITSNPELSQKYNERTAYKKEKKLAKMTAFMEKLYLFKQGSKESNCKQAMAHAHKY